MTKYTEPPEQRLWALVDKSGDCWLWHGTLERRGGYGRFFMDGKRLRAHRVAYEFAVAPIPAGLVICHRCDNPQCVNPAHLFVGTKGDNNHDRHEKGRSAGPRGVKHPRAKLSEELVVMIRSWHVEGLSYRQLAARFGMSKSAIAHIVKGRSWSHVM